MAGDSPAYLAWVRLLPCCAPGAPRGCRYVRQAHHTGRKGLSTRTEDAHAVPLCVQHHAEWDAGCGAFAGLDHGGRRRWEDEQVARLREMWAERDGGIDRQFCFGA
jgi:hypothetical protein